MTYPELRQLASGTPIVYRRTRNSRRVAGTYLGMRSIAATGQDVAQVKVRGGVVLLKPSQIVAFGPDAVTLSPSASIGEDQ